MTGMNPEVKTLWLKALRSGEYQQGTGALAFRDSDSGAVTHCCLGVLCTEAVKAGVEVRVTTAAHGLVSFDMETGTLPRSVQEWAGMVSNPLISVIKEDSPRLHGGPLTIADANDSGLTFEDLAEIIEGEF